MGGRSEGLGRLSALACAVIVAAALVWTVLAQRARRDPLPRPGLAPKEQEMLLKAIEKARAEGDTEALAAYEEMWRHIREDAAARQVGR